MILYHIRTMSMIINTPTVLLSTIKRDMYTVQFYNACYIPTANILTCMRLESKILKHSYNVIIISIAHFI